MSTSRCPNKIDGPLQNYARLLHYLRAAPHGFKVSNRDRIAEWERSARALAVKLSRCFDSDFENPDAVVDLLPACVQVVPKFDGISMYPWGASINA